ncbi:MAG: hypothetical protein ACOYM9_03175 [Bradymonadia bacterium]
MSSSSENGARFASVERVAPGTPVLAALDALVERHGLVSGELRLQGRVRDARLGLPGLPAGHDLPGESALVFGRALVDPQLGLHPLSVVLAFAERGLPHLLGGELLEGTCLELEVVVETFAAQVGVALGPDAPAARIDPAPLARAPQRPTAVGSAGLTARPTAPRPAGVAGHAPVPTRPPASVPPARPTTTPAPTPVATPPASASAPGGGWASAVAASTAPRGATAASLPAAGAAEEDDDDELRPGDLLIHPALGRCKVVSATDGEKVRVRLPAGKLTELHLRVVKVRRAADEDGTRVFRATIGSTVR